MQIEQILLSRTMFDKRSRRHAIAGDLHTVATYFSQFPDIVSMLVELERYRFNLRHDDGRWQTRVELRNDQVVSATISFDFSAAAQMRFSDGCLGQAGCTAMPADALLHELLHVYLIFTAPGRFITSSRNADYPHEHESDVIALEREFYQTMTRADGLPRPERHRHYAKVVGVSCPVCWAN